MAYPRTCPLCWADYSIGGAPDLGHLTIEARPGGTSSPWQPLQPGRVLTLRCCLCGGAYEWDYFGDAEAQLGRLAGQAAPAEAREAGRPRGARAISLSRAS